MMRILSMFVCLAPHSSFQLGAANCKHAQATDERSPERFALSGTESGAQLDGAPRRTADRHREGEKRVLRPTHPLCQTPRVRVQMSCVHLRECHQKGIVISRACLHMTRTAIIR